jgi:hypothetical protein
MVASAVATCLRRGLDSLGACLGRVCDHGTPNAELVLQQALISRKMGSFTRTRSAFSKPVLETRDRLAHGARDGSAGCPWVSLELVGPIDLGRIKTGSGFRQSARTAIQAELSRPSWQGSRMLGGMGARKPIRRPGDGPLVMVGPQGPSSRGACESREKTCCSRRQADSRVRSAFRVPCGNACLKAVSSLSVTAGALTAEKARVPKGPVS